MKIYDFLFKTLAGSILLLFMFLGLLILYFLWKALSVWLDILILASFIICGYILGVTFFPFKEEIKSVENLEKMRDVLESLSNIEKIIKRSKSFDNIIKDKILNIIEKEREILPKTEELTLSEVKHTVRRFGTNDLIDLINPYLKLSSDGRRKAKDILLDSLNTMEEELSEIQQLIDTKDISELKNKAIYLNKKYKDENTL